MNIDQFTAVYEDLLLRKKQFENDINHEYNKHINVFVNENSPLQFGKVYELTNDVFKSPRGCKRFVVYDIDVKWNGSIPIIIAGVWWLNNKTNIPQKWDRIPSFGIDNVPTTKLSDNQTNFPHPDCKENQTD